MIQNLRMPQSIARVLIHTVFSTKGREPVFHDPVFRSEVYAYLDREVGVPV
jgi:putative transposase